MDRRSDGERTSRNPHFCAGLEADDRDAAALGGRGAHARFVWGHGKLTPTTNRPWASRMATRRGQAKPRDLQNSARQSLPHGRGSVTGVDSTGGYRAARISKRVLRIVQVPRKRRAPQVRAKHCTARFSRGVFRGGASRLNQPGKSTLLHL